MCEEMILVNKSALLTVMQTAGDATCDEDTSVVYRNSGKPSTWFDHYIDADQILTDNLNESHTTITPEKIIQAIESILKVEQINSGMYCR